MAETKGYRDDEVTDEGSGSGSNSGSDPGSTDSDSGSRDALDEVDGKSEKSEQSAREYGSAYGLQIE